MAAHPVGGVLDRQVLLEAVGFGRVAEGMGEGVGGVHLEAAQEAVLPGQQQGVITGVSARVLQGNVVELWIEPGGGEDRPPISQEAGGIDEVHVAQEDQVASPGRYVAYRDNVIAAQLAGDLQAGVYAGGVQIGRASCRERV